MNIEQLALEAGFEIHQSKGHIRVGMDAIIGNDSTAKLMRFAALVRNEALEEAAVKCDELPAPPSCNSLERSLWDIATTSAGDAIRSMKEVKT